MTREGRDLCASRQLLQFFRESEYSFVVIATEGDVLPLPLFFVFIVSSKLRLCHLHASALNEVKHILRWDVEISSIENCGGELTVHGRRWFERMVRCKRWHFALEMVSSRDRTG